MLPDLAFWTYVKALLDHQRQETFATKVRMTMIGVSRDWDTRCFTRKLQFQLHGCKTDRPGETGEASNAQKNILSEIRRGEFQAFQSRARQQVDMIFVVNEYPVRVHILMELFCRC